MEKPPVYCDINEKTSNEVATVQTVIPTIEFVNNSLGGTLHNIKQMIESYDTISALSAVQEVPSGIREAMKPIASHDYSQALSKSLQIISDIVAKAYIDFAMGYTNNTTEVYNNSVKKTFQAYLEDNIVKKRIQTFFEIEEGIFYDASIFDEPDKQIITPELIIQTEEISKNMMRYLAENPNSMHDLEPREFEYVIATLFRQRGYKAEVTPKIKDGGYDIYLTHPTEIGTHTFIVECKKYSENNPVGVQIIRSLVGVLNRVETRPTGAIVATTSRFTKGAQKEAKMGTYRNILYLHDFNKITSLLKDTYLK